MRWKVIVTPSLLAAGLLLLTGPSWGYPLEGGGETMTTGELEDCATCHEEHVDAFSLSPHAALDSEGYAAGVGAASSCTACHGDTATHIEEAGGEGTILAFGDDELPSTKSAACQSCHGTAHPRFDASAHARAGLDCTSCHTVHAGPFDLLAASDPIDSSLRPDRVSDSCADCHQDVFAQFEFNERHRLQEGILECSSCHDPHAPETRWMLGGFKQEACVDCHTDKGGPFIFEHGSVRGEACTSCHSPHGSVNRHMLTFQNQAELCYSCHVAIPGFHSRFTLESQCTNCHATIHGSNFDPFFLK